jgi:hypothetical protein
MKLFFSYNIKKLSLTFLVFLMFGTLQNTYSQDLLAIVNVNDQTLPIEARERLKQFKTQVEDYLNRNKWHDEPIPPIKCTFEFNFTGTNGFDQYNTQLFIVAQREIYRKNKADPIKYTTTLRILDERVNFTYSRSMQFMKNDVIFDPLLSLLNYYAFLIVGFDEDSYYPKGGTKYFQKAQDICNKLMTDKTGWTETGGGSKPSRLQLVQELTNPRFEDFRKSYFEYHWMGLDSLALNKTNAYQYILRAVEKISVIKKKEIKAFNVDIFFDEKNVEIAETFLDYGSRSIYDKLIQYDPTHQNTYEDYKKRAR